MIKPKNIDVIIGCEKSQVVCEAFRALGFNAFSCDTEPATGSHPEWHLQMDVFDALRLRKWTLGIFHPPCTFMSKAGARFMFPKAGVIDEERLAKAMAEQWGAYVLKKEWERMSRWERIKTSISNIV